MSKPRYLIVDDDKLIRDYMDAVFSDEAIISTACNGREALSLLTKTNFDVVICDFQMPYLNGIDLFKEMKSDKSTTCDKFILCTGSLTQEIYQFCSNNKIPFCQKPIKNDVLKKIVRRVTKCNAY